ncbi:hypothetical protein M3Y97_00109100 [Aphelenchoides bicaudatus]|nr:hypothetical protein M3Y97_00109100 [Aphelenchoides bicaudatus]
MSKLTLLLLSACALVIVSGYGASEMRYKPGYNFQLRRLPEIKKRFYDWGDAQPTQSPVKRFYQWADGQGAQIPTPTEREFIKEFLNRKGPDYLANHKMFSQYKDSLLIR